MNNYEQLATSIVAKACEDYVYYKREYLSTNDDLKAELLLEKIDECVDFFYSDWCKLLMQGSMPKVEKLLDALDVLAQERQGRIIKLYGIYVEGDE